MFARRETGLGNVGRDEDPLIGSETLEPGEAVAGERVLVTYDVADTCFAAGEHPFDNDYSIRKSKDDEESAIAFTWGFDVIVAE